MTLGEQRTTSIGMIGWETTAGVLMVAGAGAFILVDEGDLVTGEGEQQRVKGRILAPQEARALLEAAGVEFPVDYYETAISADLRQLLIDTIAS